MNDDWMKDFNLDEPENQQDSANAENKEIALDSLGIPILEEVVFLEDDYSFDDEITFDSVPEPQVEEIINSEEYFPEAPPITNPDQLSTTTPRPDEEPIGQEALNTDLSIELDNESQENLAGEAKDAIELEKLRSNLKYELRQIMEKYSSTLAREISANITADLEQRISFELKQSLHGHIDTIVDQAIDDFDKEN